MIPEPIRVPFRSSLAMRVAWIVLVAACSGRSVGDGPGDGAETSGSVTSTADSATSTSDASSSSPSVSESTTGAVSCPGEPDNQCVEADTLACAHLATDEECIDGSWRCSDTFIDFDNCVCYFGVPQPECVVSDGNGCTDVLEPAICSGTPGDGAWICPEGTTPIEQCETGTSSSTG